MGFAPRKLGKIIAVHNYHMNDKTKAQTEQGPMEFYHHTSQCFNKDIFLAVPFMLLTHYSQPVTHPLHIVIPQPNSEGGRNIQHKQLVV